MSDQTKIIKELILANEKLTALADLNNEFYLTKEEKKEASFKLNNAHSSDEIKDTYQKLRKIYDSSYHFAQGDAKWSPGFIRQLLMYYENQAGFNPVERLKQPFAIVRGYFEMKAIEEELDVYGKQQLEHVTELLPDAMKEIQTTYVELEGELFDENTNIMDTSAVSGKAVSEKKEEQEDLSNTLNEDTAEPEDSVQGNFQSYSDYQSS